MSKQRLQRHIQKFAKATQISFAERALQRDQIHFLKRVNNEAKVRRATKSLVLGKAKVMSYEDLEQARAKRAAKASAKVKGKGKRDQKADVARRQAEATLSRCRCVLVDQTDATSKPSHTLCGCPWQFMCVGPDTTKPSYSGCSLLNFFFLLIRIKRLQIFKLIPSSICPSYQGKLMH
jgi:hypothetical protein